MPSFAQLPSSASDETQAECPWCCRFTVLALGAHLAQEFFLPSLLLKAGVLIIHPAILGREVAGFWTQFLTLRLRIFWKW